MQRRADFLQARDQECAFDRGRQVFCRTAAPVMKKHHPRLFVRHVLMNAAQVFTPIVLSIFTPCMVAGRPNVNFTIPSFASPFVRKILFSGSPEMEFFSGNEFPPNDSFGCGLAARTCLTASYISFTASAS